MKKDGNVSFCVDYRKVNQVAKFDAYPMLGVGDILEEMGPAKYISTLDLARGYWQVPMAQESKEKMALQLPLALQVEYDALQTPHCTGHLPEADESGAERVSKICSILH